MEGSSSKKRCGIPALASISLVVLAGQAFHHPNALRDLVSGAFPSDVRLAYPWIYQLFAPFFQLADHWTLLGLNQHFALLAELNLAWILARCSCLRRRGFSLHNGITEFLKLLLANLGLALFAAAVILPPRPMARLQSLNPDLLVLDFHSHTKYSWDGRKTFTPYDNLQWHARAGYQAAFITDHNVVDGALEAQELLESGGLPEDVLPMNGEEVSLYQSHWALLGNPKLWPNVPYDRGMPGIRDFIQDARASTGLVVIASLPEYWFYHWGDREDFARWGVDGFEIANSAPKALDFTPALRASMVDFCRAHDLVMTGISDNYGWSSTAYAWNLVEIPGWRALAPEALEKAVIRTLKERRFRAVRVVTRVKAEPREGWGWLALDPARQVWAAARSLPRLQAGVTLVWLWLPWWLIKKTS